MRTVDLLKSEYQHLTARELLELPLDCLAGVSSSTTAALTAVYIKTVFDLATSAMFKVASDALQSVRKGHRLPAFASTDLLDANTEAGTAAEFLELPISVFHRVSPNDASQIETDTGMKIVRDLATWPPYQAAKSILNEAYNLLPQGSLDNEYPDDLVPGSRRYPTDQVQYEVLVFDRILHYRRSENGSLRLTVPVEMAEVSLSRRAGNTVVAEVEGYAEPGDALFSMLEQAGPIDISVTASPEYGFQYPAVGAVLTYSQSWYVQGLALGQLLHTVALAPGESTRIAMIDWSRRSLARTDEDIGQVETLSAVVDRSRSIGEVTNAVATEAQRGWSKSETEAASSQFGAAGGVAGPLGTTGAVGALGASYGTASTRVVSQGWTTASGERTLYAEMTQEIADRTQQAASSARNRRATIVREVSQEESERISTRIVANYNHMHALSIEYFEIVQLYRVAVELARATRCLFIPMKIVDFSKRGVVFRYRQVIAAAGLTPEVRELAWAEPGSLLASAPHRGAPWREQNVAALSRFFQRDVPGGVGESESDALLFGDHFYFAGFGWSDNVPIAAVSFEAPDGSVQSFGIRDWGNDGDAATGLRFTPAGRVPSDGNKRASEQYRRIRLRKEAGQEQFSGQFTLSVRLFASFGQGGSEETGDALVWLNVPISIPADQAEFIALEFQRTFDLGQLAEHLADNAFYYSQAIWRSLDSATVALLLTPYTVSNRPVMEVIDPIPIATAGNYLVFRMYTEAGDTEWERFKDKHNLVPGIIKEDVVPLPSGGVFAEAVLGRANSAEKIDITRFWNWQDSPIPLVPTEIASIQSGSRAQPDDLQPGQLDAPVINIVNPPPLPDPTGLSAILQAVQNGNMFRDMSGLAAIAGLAQTGLAATSAGAGQAATTAGGNMAVVARLMEATLRDSSAMRTSGGYPGPGASNITNAGAAINHGARLDQNPQASPAGGAYGSTTDFDGRLSTDPSLRIGAGGASRAVSGSHEVDAFDTTLRGANALGQVFNPQLGPTSSAGPLSRPSFDPDADEIVWALQNPGMLERMIINGRESTDDWALWNFPVGGSSIEGFEERLQANRGTWETWLNNGDDIEVIGYASVSGSEEANDRLSLERAQAVRQWLVEEIGIPNERLTTYGGGIANDLTKGPIFDPRTRAWNRRVELRRTGRPLASGDWDRLSQAVRNSVIVPDNAEADRTMRARLQCLIQALRDPGREDTFLAPGQQYLVAKRLLNHPDYYDWIVDTDNWHRPRNGLQLLFSLRKRAQTHMRPGFTDGQLLHELGILDKAVLAGITMVEVEGRGSDLHVVSRLARTWLARKQADPNSVYACYVDRR